MRDMAHKMYITNEDDNTIMFECSVCDRKLFFDKTTKKMYVYIDDDGFYYSGDEYEQHTLDSESGFGIGLILSSFTGPDDKYLDVYRDFIDGLDKDGK